MIKIDEKGSDLLVQVAVHDHAFLLLVALAHVTNEVGEPCLGAVDFELDFAVWLEAGHHDLDGPEDIDAALDHLAAELALGIALDDDLAAFGMGHDVDLAVTVDDDLAAEHIHAG